MLITVTEPNGARTYSQPSALALLFMRYAPEFLFRFLVFLGIMAEISRMSEKVSDEQTGDSAEVESFSVEVESSSVSDEALTCDTEVKSSPASDEGSACDLARRERQDDRGFLWQLVSQRHLPVVFNSRKSWDDIIHQMDIDLGRHMLFVVEGVRIGGPSEKGGQINEAKVAELRRALQQEGGGVGVVCCNRGSCFCHKNSEVLEIRSIIERWIGGQQRVEEENKKAALDLCAQGLFAPLCEVIFSYASSLNEQVKIPSGGFRQITVKIEEDFSVRYVIIKAELEFFYYEANDLDEMGEAVQMLGSIQVRVPMWGPIEEVNSVCRLEKRLEEGWELVFLRDQ